MKHGSLFSGIGGFDLAAEWMGWENKFHCEWNEFGQKVLNYYWPNAISYGDITKTDFSIWRGRIDIVTGGFPCQPFSVAGKRKGKGDNRHLWPEMVRAIREIQPSWVVGENVPGIVNWSRGLVFREIQTNMENEGYEIFPVLNIPACSKNAPHRRERIWFVAHSNDANERIFKRENNRKEENLWREYERDVPNQLLSNGNVAHSNNKGLQRSKKNGNVGSSRERRNEQPTRFFQSAWQEFPTQHPLYSGNDGVSTGLSGITFPKHRTESIKAYGNSIVPQIAYEIFKAIEQYENKILT